MNSSKKRGRPAIERSDEIAKKVKGYAAVGVPILDIAKACGMSENTLRKLYLPEIEKAGIEATAQVAGKLFQECMGGNVTAMIFWMKVRGKWSEKSEVEVTGGGGVLVVNPVMSPEEWAAAAAKQQAALIRADD